MTLNTSNVGFARIYNFLFAVKLSPPPSSLFPKNSVHSHCLCCSSCELSITAWIWGYGVAVSDSFSSIQQNSVSLLRDHMFNNMLRYFVLFL